MAQLVVRAIVDSPQGDRAEMVGYTLGGEEALQPLAGQMSLRAVRLGSADVLSMEFREPRRHTRCLIAPICRIRGRPLV